MSKRRKVAREKDLTSRYLSGDWDDDRIGQEEKFDERTTGAEQRKILKTALMRAEEAAEAPDLETLPIGEVVQVFSLYCEVQHDGKTHLCVVRKTMTKVSNMPVIVGDLVRFRLMDITTADASQSTGAPQAVVEHVLPRKTVLTRTDSFKGIEKHPIVANAEQMLLVASIHSPDVKWGLIDRMIVAAKSGGLLPIICLNKVDLIKDDADAQSAGAVMAHYETLGIRTFQASVEKRIGLDALREILKGHTTVLAGHSGVGKSSLIRSIQPQLDLRIGEVSNYTDKGRHTTTSARRYVLDFGGAVIDTPGVKMFGLWGVTRENLVEFFPDVDSGTAPDWRRESYKRIEASLPVEPH